MRASQDRLYAVLIVDVVSSSQVPHVGQTLAWKLRNATKAHLGDGIIDLPYAVTAGDEFQAVTSHLVEIPDLIFDLRIRFHPLVLWIAVGIGKITGAIVEPVNRLTGEAFFLARRGVERVKSAKDHKFPALTAFRTANPEFDLVANSMYGLHDTLVQGISDKQWTTIAAYRKKGRGDRTARAMRVDESTVSRNLRRGHYWQMQETIIAMRAMIQRYFP